MGRRSLVHNAAELDGTEYQTIPRGRVTWQVKEKSALVYLEVLFHSSSARKKIAAFFELSPSRTQWETDEHYDAEDAARWSDMSEPA